MKNIIIGIDLGGTNFRIGAVDENNKISDPHVLQSTLIADAADPVGMMCSMIERYMHDTGTPIPEAISIGVPSSVANDKETVICTSNIRDKNGRVVFRNTNIAADIKKRFGVPVFVNNDVNNILLYDAVEKGLQNNKIVVGIYIGTGVGASVLINGSLLEGKDGAELDLGHIPFFKGQVPCSCGKKGCCECYASGWRLQEIRREFFPETDIKDMFTLHSDSEPVKDFIYSCAHVYALMATIFNPDTLVVGGGVMEMRDFPREAFCHSVKEQTGRDVMTYGFDFVFSEPFVGKGIAGAAIFARSRLRH